MITLRSLDPAFPITQQLAIEASPGRVLVLRAKLTDYPSSAVAMPHLFQKSAVPGICLT
ncbi:hypothetical protein [[Pseudomonas] boreopolis]|uniref:hypothetical protein n=1 Tax=Xanthomonas boreopolis TaxID=86183 RepID=UPI003D9BAE2C